MDNDTNSSGSINSDEATKKRFANLAVVGNALSQTTSDKSLLTEFYLAKEALIKFKSEVDLLNLDPESQNGIDKLIKFLQKEIDKKLITEDKNSGF